MTNIAFKNRDPESDIDWNDWYVCPERMTNIETDVTITIRLCHSFLSP